MYASPAEGVAVRDEINKALEANTRTLHSYLGAVGDVNARLRRAAMGNLRDGDELVPVRRDPTLWEIRWDLRRVGKYRLYYTARSDEPYFVGLRFHQKVVLPSPAATTAQQDSEVDLASSRLQQGPDSCWGHTLNHCVHCVDP